MTKNFTLKLAYMHAYYIFMHSLTFSLCTPLPGSFVLLLTHGYSVSPMLEQTLLASAVPPTVLQSKGILSLLTSVTFNPPMPSKLHKELASRNNTTSDFRFCLLTCPPAPPPPHLPPPPYPHSYFLTVLLCTCVCVCVFMCVCVSKCVSGVCVWCVCVCVCMCM